jgi:hypothetical protein
MGGRGLTAVRVIIGRSNSPLSSIIGIIQRRERNWRLIPSIVVVIRWVALIPSIAVVMTVVRRTIVRGIGAAISSFSVVVVIIIIEVMLVISTPGAWGGSGGEASPPPSGVSAAFPRGWSA